MELQEERENEELDGFCIFSRERFGLELLPTLLERTLGDCCKAREWEFAQGCLSFLHLHAAVRAPRGPGVRFPFVLCFNSLFRRAAKQEDLKGEPTASSCGVCCVQVLVGFLKSYSRSTVPLRAVIEASEASGSSREAASSSESISLSKVRSWSVGVRRLVFLYCSWVRKRSCETERCSVEFMFFFSIVLLCRGFDFYCNKGPSCKESEVERFGALLIGIEEETIEEWGLGRIPTPSPFPLSLEVSKRKVKRLNKATID